MNVNKFSSSSQFAIDILGYCPNRFCGPYWQKNQPCRKEKSMWFSQGWPAEDVHVSCRND